MALPGQIVTEPSEEMWFNAPFVDDQHSHIRLSNDSEKKLAWIFKGTDTEGIKVSPRAGVLEPRDDIVLDVLCAPLHTHTDKKHKKDRLTLEWFNAPVKAEHFNKDWLHSTKVLRKKTLNVKYNDQQ